MNENVIVLRDKFKSLEESLDLGDRSFADSLFEYCAYIASSKELSEIVRSMALEGEIDAQTFHWLFIFGAVRNTVRNFNLGKMDPQSGQKDVGIPLFWDKEIEKHYRVAEALGVLLYSAKETSDQQEDKETIDIHDMVTDESGHFLKHEDIPLKEVIFRVRMFQNQLLERLTQPAEPSVSFDSQESILYVGNNKIYIRKYSEQYHALRVIFEYSDTLEKEWFFSEIAELMDQYKNYKGKHFHNYFSAIKRRVRSETGIDDLFITTNQSVSINRKYLK